MFWDAVLVITVPIFLTYFCSLSSSKKVQILPIVISAVILIGAVLTYVVYQPYHAIAKSISFGASAALLSTLLTRALIKEVNKIKNSFDRQKDSIGWR